MKKTLIVLIILLIILAIGQSIYYNVRKSNISPNTLSENGTEEVEGRKNVLYINGMLKIYEDFNPKISLENLQSEFYKLLYETLPKIAEDNLSLSDDEVLNYYKKNTKKINSMNILDEEEFFMIATQLKNVTKDGVLLHSQNIDTDSIRKENNDILFDITFTYDNEAEVVIGTKISEIDDKIEFFSHCDVDKLFEKYNGNVSKKQLLDKINLFISKVREIRENTSYKTENEKKQYFDTSSEQLKEIGIITEKDLIDVATRINLLNWRHADLNFQYYKINLDTYTEDTYYNYFETVLNYNYFGKIHLKIGLSKRSNIDPNIKISIFGNESE